jgi:hypothetical protein
MIEMVLLAHPVDLDMVEVVEVLTIGVATVIEEEVVVVVVSVETGVMVVGAVATEEEVVGVITVSLTVVEAAVGPDLMAEVVEDIEEQEVVSVAEEEEVALRMLWVSMAIFGLMLASSQSFSVVRALRLRALILTSTTTSPWRSARAVPLLSASSPSNPSASSYSKT